jgi:DNA-directed RNA polymerase subunit omega
MQSHLVEKASKIIKIPQVLVNVISQRVRQLSAGHRALVEIGPRMGLADIALSEVIARKLTYESAGLPVTAGVAPGIVELAAFAPKTKAA